MKKFTGLVIIFFSLFIGTSIIHAEKSDQFIIINKSINKLAFFENGKLVRVFKVATGRSSEYTPEGTFPIVNKIKNRPYYKQNIPGGHPSNPLGDRWLGLNARGTYGTTYAIHGNANPASIGTYASAGCVRMYDEEVHWLFDRVKLHTNVMITRSSQSFEAIAASKGYTPFSKLQSVTVVQQSPQPINTSVHIHANANIKSHYRFFIHENGVWKSVQNYSTSSQFTWKPDKEGSYQIKVQVKSISSKKEFDDEKVISYDVFVPATVETFEAKAVGPLPINSEIDFSIASNKEVGNVVQYEVHDGNEWSLIQPYSEEHSFTWKPQEPGTYKVRVRVKHSISPNEYDDEQELKYTIFKPASLTALQADLESPQPIHSRIIISSETNQDSSILYKFDVNEGGTWKTIQDFSTSSIVEWKPEISGLYEIRVYAKHELSKEAFDSEEVIQYQIYKPARIGVISSNTKGLQIARGNVKIKAASNHEFMYRYSIFNGNKWVILQDFSSNHQLNWKPGLPGMYKVKIEVKHRLSTQEYDDVGEVPFIIYQAGFAEAILPEENKLSRNGVFSVKADRVRKK